ncbi:MAG TPA: MFS transporter [Patescibacteria group bacterium]|nr:MFS transporter [Patescibacteria group bacterium]
MSLQKNIKLLTWFNFFTDFKLYAPIAIIYFTHATGSFALGMSIFSIATISSALFEIPTGVLSDRIGRKRTVMYGALAAVLYSVFYALGQSYWILAVGAIFDGLSQSFYSGNNEALLYDTLAETKKEHQYDEFLGKTSAMFQVALGISAILGGFLATWSFPLIMWISVIPQILCLCLSLLLSEPQINSTKSGNMYQHLKAAYKNFLSNKKLRLLSISSIVGYGFGEAGYQFQSAFYNTLWPLWAISIAKTFSNIGATLSFHFSSRLIRKFGGIKILIIDNIYNRIINIFSTALPTIFSPLLMSSTSIFFGVTTVTKNALMQKEFTNEQRATMGSLNSFLGSIFFGIIAFILGFVADKVTPAHALLILQVFQIGNLWIYWKLFKHDQNNSIS